MGSSIIKHAALYARHRPMGRHLGSRDKCCIFWSGRSGLRHHQVIDFASKMLYEQEVWMPHVLDFIILHVGGNDIGFHNCGLLRLSLKTLFSQLALMFPQAKIVWSCILPRLNWRNAIGTQNSEKSRARINRAMIHFAVQQGHRAIKHCEFNDKSPGLFAADGVHLSDVGTDLFLLNIQSALETFMSSAASVYPVV